MRDPLFENKLIASLLVAMLIVFGFPLAVDRVSNNDHRQQSKRKNMTTPEVAQSGADKEVDLRFAAADAQRGKRLSALCVSCHSFDAEGAEGIGPNLWGVVDRKIASNENFSYSMALRNRAGVWTTQELDSFLLDTQAYAPGTTMFLQISNDRDRADIIVYLSSLSLEQHPF